MTVSSAPTRHTGEGRYPEVGGGWGLRSPTPNIYRRSPGRARLPTAVLSLAKVFEIYRRISQKDRSRCFVEFSGRDNTWSLDTIQQTVWTLRGMEGSLLKYEDVIA